MPSIPQPVGSQWLKDHYKLAQFALTHASYIGSNPSLELTSKGNIDQVYGPRYQIGKNEPIYHLEFALKYDDLNLDFLKTVLERIPRHEINQFIADAPGGKYARKIGFFYEFLTGDRLEWKGPASGNYVDLLDEEKYVAGVPVKDTRWRVNNNLPGNSSFCPVVRITKELTELLEINVRDKIIELRDRFPQDIFHRAVNYLYRKETRSSYEIEREQPSPDRTEKFVALLITAGTESREDLLDKQRLIQLQRAIVDPRFTADNFRDFQNYVGELLPSFVENIHYICPPGEMVESLMHGMKECALKTINVPAEIRAAMIAFGFVFVHPFEDGNGRLHRFLIHDILVQDGLVPQGQIIPVSGRMLNHLHEYDQILERYSRPLMRRIRYEKKENGEIMVMNAREVEGYFRYPDLTDQCVYLMRTIHATLEEDMPEELLFIQRYDEVKRELQKIVDMPDKMIGMMITFLHQNKGVFPKRRRAYFEKLTEKEIIRMQEAYRKIFELG